MGFFSDIYNYYKPGGGEDAVLRNRLQTMGDKPYAKDALAKLTEVSADGYQSATDKNPVISTFMTSLGRHLGSVPANQRYAEFKSAVQGIDAEGKVTPMLTAFDQAPENTRAALMNAVTHNPHFIQHITQNGTGSLASLLTKENLSTHGNQIADILNTIANNPGAPPPQGNGYDFKKLDAVGKAAQTFFDANKPNSGKTPQEIEAAKRALLTSVTQAGGNVPALANFNIGMLGQFMKDLFTGDVNSAIGNLAQGLGIQGQQLADFQKLMQPVSGFMKFMGQDYYEYAAHYGPRFAESGRGAMNTIDGIMNGQRVAFQAPATGTEPRRTIGEGGALTGELRRAAEGRTPADPVIPAAPAYQPNGINPTFGISP